MSKIFYISLIALCFIVTRLIPKKMTRQPAIFVGHGNPMLALAGNDDEYVKVWRKMAKSLPKPKAILAISAHWYVPETSVTAQENPKTIHDFGNFPQELFDVEYPAPGSPELAKKVADIVATVNDGEKAKLIGNEEWGLDHGTWAVIKHMYPDADIPIVQLSLDTRKGMAYHYELGRQLAKLRDENILIVGSGNLVHNFAYFKLGSKTPQPWAVEYVDWIKAVTQDKNVDRDNAKDHPIVNWQKHKYGPQSQMAEPDHFLPALYILGTADNNEKIQWNSESWDLGSFSMACFTVGA